MIDASFGKRGLREASAVFGTRVFVNLFAPLFASTSMTPLGSLVVIRARAYGNNNNSAPPKRVLEK